MSTPKTILYVEDDAVVRMAYQSRLQKQGFIVEPAMDGLAAMRSLSARVPDLVLLDLMLPRMNGEEVLKFIRSQSKLRTVPVIILSTNSIIDVKQEYLLEQANKRLIKQNCTFATMLEAIFEVLPSAIPSHYFAPANATARPTSAFLPVDLNFAAA